MFVARKIATPTSSDATFRVPVGHEYFKNSAFRLSFYVPVKNSIKKKLIGSKRFQILYKIICKLECFYKKKVSVGLIYFKN